MENSILKAGGKDATLRAVRSLAISTALVIGFTFLTVLGARVVIPLPFTPVPITLQTLMVLLAGAFIGSARGSISQVLYLLWGVGGLPLFAGGLAGFAVIAGPTGGYIVGFIFAAYLVGRMIRPDAALWSQALVFSLGVLVILAAGWLHLTLIYTGGDALRALVIGVLPFLPGAALKVAAATAIYRAARRALS